VQAQGGVRTSSSGFSLRRKAGSGGRGTGAVMATGSYEGSLTTEGTSGHLSCRFSRIGSDVGLGGSLSPPTHVSRSTRNVSVVSTHEGA